MGLRGGYKDIYADVCFRVPRSPSRFSQYPAGPSLRDQGISAAGRKWWQTERKYAAALKHQDRPSSAPAGPRTKVSMDGRAVWGTKTVRVVSAGDGHGNMADFYLDGQKIQLDVRRFAYEHRRGINVITLDPETHQMVTARAYDVGAHPPAANAQLAVDLDQIPVGRTVLIAVKGSGLEHLDGRAVRAMRRCGATIGVGRKHEGYVLITTKGGPTLAEHRNWFCDVEAGLPRKHWYTELEDPYALKQATGAGAAASAQPPGQFNQQAMLAAELGRGSVDGEAMVRMHRQIQAFEHHARKQQMALISQEEELQFAEVRNARLREENERLRQQNMRLSRDGL